MGAALQRQSDPDGTDLDDVLRGLPEDESDDAADTSIFA